MNCSKCNEPLPAQAKFCPKYGAAIPVLAYYSGLDFSSLIAKLTLNFTGRAWVFDEIERWLANPSGAGLFLLTGEQGD